MKYDNIDLLKLQEQNVADAPRLVDTSFLWRVERMKSRRLAELYRIAGYVDYAERCDCCATWLRFNVLGDRKTLRSANFCRLRLCPMCVARGARVRALKLSKIMDTVQADHGCQYLFLTLTVKNVSGDKLCETLTQLADGWHRFIRQRPVAAVVKGWFRALEITRNNKPGDPSYGTYHPHLHVIWSVEDGYFRKRNGLYLTPEDIQARWRQACRLDYDPVVDIRRTRSRKKSGGDDNANAAAVLEAAKYATKDSDYISNSISDDEAVEVVTIYTQALHRRRLTAFGGWLKDEARRLQAEDLDNVDLTEGDGSRIRDDLAEMIEEYGWHCGAGDYILSRRYVNPLRVMKVEQPRGSARDAPAEQEARDY